jgi:hypothetical protein
VTGARPRPRPATRRRGRGCPAQRRGPGRAAGRRQCGPVPGGLVPRPSSLRNASDISGITVPRFANRCYGPGIYLIFAVQPLPCWPFRFSCRDY